MSDVTAIVGLLIADVDKKIQRMQDTGRQYHSSYNTEPREAKDLPPHAQKALKAIQKRINKWRAADNAINADISALSKSVEPSGILIHRHYSDNGFVIAETQAAARERIDRQNAERKERLENLKKLRSKAIELSLNGASPELLALAKEIRRALKGKVANVELDD